MNFKIVLVSRHAKAFTHSRILFSLFETAVGVHGFSVFFSWQFHFDKTDATAVDRYFNQDTLKP
jgi:hypothetical protein